LRKPADNQGPKVIHNYENMLPNVEHNYKNMPDSTNHPYKRLTLADCDTTMETFVEYSPNSTVYNDKDVLTDINFKFK
jgi:hypothetical protein